MQSSVIKTFGALRPWLPGLVGLGAAYHINTNTAYAYSSPAIQDETETSVVSFHGNRSRRAVVIGAGVAGISSAYELHQNGFEVIVVDASIGGPGAECSAVAAGGMQRTNPVVDRKKWREILSNLCFGSEFRYFYVDWIKTLTDPHFVRWSLSFVYNSLVQPKSLLHQQDEMLKFTDWAIAQFVLDRTIASVVKESQIAARGALMLNTTQSSEHCQEPNEEVLDTAAKIHSIEPFVKQWLPETCCAIYQPDASNGNSELFTKALARWLEQKDTVKFICQTPVKKFHYQGKRVTAIELENNIRIDLNGRGDEVVIAAGSWTPKLLWQLNEYVPIYPLKGYCLEIPNEQKTQIKGIITDGVTYFSRLGKDLRITAIGEFAGWDTTPTESVNTAFRNYVETKGIALEGIPTRCGLRPMSTDGAVIAGKLVGWENVSINTGPGSNGWKIALGAAKVLVHDMVPDDSSSGTLPFDQSVLSPEGRVKSTLLWSKLCLWRHGS